MEATEAVEATVAGEDTVRTVDHRQEEAVMDLRAEGVMAHRLVVGEDMGHHREVMVVR